MADANGRERDRSGRFLPCMKERKIFYILYSIFPSYSHSFIDYHDKKQTNKYLYVCIRILEQKLCCSLIRFKNSIHLSKGPVRLLLTQQSHLVFSRLDQKSRNVSWVSKKKKNLSLLVISASSCIAYAAASGNITRVKRERREKGHGRGKGSRVSNFHPLC